MNTTTERLHFSTVRIIESLPAGEILTGRNLFDELEPMGLMSKPQVTTEYTSVETANELRVKLAAIRDEVLATGRTPILQLETHGNNQGVGMASGEFVPWATLRPWLTEVNEATGLNLFVLLSACNGADLVQVVRPIERAAVLALIGPKRAMLPSELQGAFIAFYGTMFAATDATVAWKAMNDVIDPNKTTFAVFLAKFNFRYIMHNFLTTYCTEDALANRERRLEAEALQGGFPPDFIEAQRPAMKAYLRDFQAHFDRTKTHHFFIDRYPDNASRFPVTLEECWSAPG